jgi:thioredoxin reductase (NADPH)
MPSSVLTTAPEQAPALNRALIDNPFLVVGLCAAWCNTCAEFRKTFEDIAAERPDSTFVWIDIEDDANIADDIDIENFPTIAVFHRARALHFGASLPQRSVVTRLLDALSADSPEIPTDPSVVSLPRRLMHGDADSGQSASINASSGSPSKAATN